MSILNNIIRSMRKEEIRHYKLLAGKSHGNKQRKDFRLFDYIKLKGEKYEESTISEELYGKASKNPFYRLRFRLLEDVNKSLWLQHFKEDPFTHGLYLFSLARLHYNHKRYEVAAFYLGKASREALKNEHYEILEMIYSQYILLARTLTSINPEEYIRLRSENRQRLEALNAIDDLLAVVTYRINVSLNYSRKDTEIVSLLQTTLEEYASDQNLVRIPKVRFKIYEGVSRILIQRQEYPALESYLKEVFNTFSKEDLFQRNNHEVKLKMLATLVNALFATGKYEESLYFSGVLQEAMNEFDGMLYEEYEFFYYNAQFLNYSILNVDKAIETLLKMKRHPSLKATTQNRISVYINLSALLFQTSQFRKSLRELIDLSLLDEFRNADESLRFRVAVFELMVRYRLKQNEWLTGRIPQVGKDFEGLLGNPVYVQDRQFLELLRDMNQSAFDLRQARLREKLQGFLTTHTGAESASVPIYAYESFIREELR